MNLYWYMAQWLREETMVYWTVPPYCVNKKIQKNYKNVWCGKRIYVFTVEVGIYKMKQRRRYFRICLTRE